MVIEIAPFIHSFAHSYCGWLQSGGGDGTHRTRSLIFPITAKLNLYVAMNTLLLNDIPLKRCVRVHAQALDHSSMMHSTHTNTYSFPQNALRIYSMHFRYYYVVR